MTDPAFVHLRLHTEFSLVDGLVRIKELVGAAKDMQMPAVAITDQVNLFALVKFFKATTGAGIKPIFGSDIWIENEAEPESEPTRMTLLVMNEMGYRNLMELVSLAYEKGQNVQSEKAILKKSWISEKSAGLIALSGAKEGEVGRALQQGNGPGRKALEEWQNIFPNRFYLEVQRTGRAGDEDCVHASVQLAHETCCPLVATNEVMFIKPEDFEAHEVRVCINQSRTLEDPNRPKNYTEQQYLRSPEEMVELFSDIPSAISNSVEIAKRCNSELDLGTYYLPKYPIPAGKTMDQFFADVSWKGLEDRLEILLDKDDPEYAEKRKPYEDRMDFELDIITQMGFPGYFLIVMDFIQWGKDNGVPVGPGRGSGAGSLVAYAQKITDLDPLEYDLLFERFLNPERVSMPDFDIDFCMDNRDKVIDYVAETYGRDAVSQIVTFGTMAAKAVVRDVARVQGKAFGLADKLSKLIPFEIGMTLSRAMDEEPLMREFVNSNEEAQEIMEMAFRLEGLTRNVGKHAGGVVIAPTKLTDFSATYCDEFGHGLVTQFDKNDVEEAGLVKFDFLGLRTLTIVDWAVKTIDRIRAKTGEEPLDIALIDLEDRTTFDLLQSAETTAVFQLESSGMKDLVTRLQPSRFEDIVALVALFRPGPLQSGMVDDFILRKHGQAELAYPHADYQLDSLQPVLEPTYGIILYQEQVMQIAQVMAGYTLGGADMLRRAMGKKKPEEMAKQRTSFLEGSEQNGIDRDLAGNIFDLVEKFAGYGFNKSHSAAYALVSYQTAWLKAHYPAPFMAAVLSSDMQNTEKVVIFIEECRNMKLPLVLPDVNCGEYMFTVNDAGEIVYGLGAVKGVGEGPIESIVAARAEGDEFSDIFDFCKRVGSKKLNKRVLEALVRAGALDRLTQKTDRAQLWAAIPEALKAADQSERNQSAGMFDLFGEVEAEQPRDPYAEYMKLRQWTDKERLQGEKDTLGLYVTGHPIDEYESELPNFISKRIAELQPQRGQQQKMLGLVVDIRVKKTKKGDPLCFVTLDDRTSRIEVSLFGESYDENRHALTKDAILLIEGEITVDSYSGTDKLKVRGNSIVDITQCRARYGKHIEVDCDAGQLKERSLREFEKLLQANQGRSNIDVALRYSRADAKATLGLGREWKVEPTDELLLKLKDQFGGDAVRIRY
ncbi:DNA polymerase III subunit alpha [Amphritea balenae]|uniref:DNA polymerase III subunit alpha n=1 Tax=Amphritea balenae TaxID=452629 RepID=A0A3P1SN84_9GAMM|nr:DNA polymerase III subunit alpha [Amphritea balenae]RRC98653.1 DNA polymerase III subunit alpha [Amphritea balenae]GGK66293.1 DNA polymerase III subunit alpha [Amphritea balenae]